MTGGSPLFDGLSSVVLYGVPLVLFLVGLVIWLLRRTDRTPPWLRSVGPDRSWIKTALDVVNGGLKEDRWTPAIEVTLARTDYALFQHHGIKADSPPIFWRYRRSLPEEARTLLAADRQLRAAYFYASRTESDRPLDLIARWRRPVWRARVHSLVDSVLTEIEPVLPKLEAAP